MNMRMENEVGARGALEKALNAEAAGNAEVSSATIATSAFVDFMAVRPASPAFYITVVRNGLRSAVELSRPEPLLQ